MASSKVMASSKPRNSDLSTSSPRSRRASASSSPPPSATKPAHQSLSHSQPPSDFMIGSNNSRDLTPSMPSPSPTMTVDGILRNVYATNPSSESTLLDAQITLIDSVLPPQSIETSSNGFNNNNNNSSGQDTGSVVSVFPQSSGKTVDDVWREIVAGRKEMKEETDEMMTLEDFLVKAGAVDVGGEGGGEEDEVKMPQTERLSGGVFAFDTVPPESAFQVLDKVEGSIIGFGNEMDLVAGGSGVGGGGRGKRGRAPVLEPLDKAAQQRQKRMIKNRESAARSRERKQAYQVELESLAVRLEEENEQLLKEKEERTRKRFKQLMEQIVPVVEKRRPPRVLRRIHSWRW